MLPAVKQIDCAVFDIGNVLVRWDPRNFYRRMGYLDTETYSILAEIGLLEINHRVLDAGGAFCCDAGEPAPRRLHFQA